MQSEELIERVLAFAPAIYLMGECLYSYTKSRVRGLVFHVCFWGGYLGLIFDYGIFALIIYCMIYHLISVGQDGCRSVFSERIRSFHAYRRA